MSRVQAKNQYVTRTTTVARQGQDETVPSGSARYAAKSFAAGSAGGAATGSFVPRSGGSEGGAVANELRDDPLFSASRRAPRMQRPPIGHAVLERVDEEQALSAPTLVRDSEVTNSVLPPS